MKLTLLTSSKFLGKAYLKQSLKREQIDLFNSSLARLFERIKEGESEEHLKNIVADFLKDTWYKPAYEINTSGRADLVIHNGKSSADSVGVIIEVKRPSNTTEMISPERPNVKALHELLHYYMQERYLRDNKELKHLIICNIYEWYIFDAVDFERFFFCNQRLVKSYKEWNDGLLVSANTDWFYQEIAKPFVEKELSELPCVCFDLRDFKRIVGNTDKLDDNKLINLYKLLSPPHLLKLPFANDSNSLNREFYAELLHIIGLEEVKDKGKKLIRRKGAATRNDGSLLENTISVLTSQRVLENLDNPEQFGADVEERLFSVGLELCITWLDRILFLKLLEGRLIAHHRGDRRMAFLNSQRITGFDDLQELFFEVLAVRSDERSVEVRKRYGAIPYLNSSLFEPCELERKAVHISSLKEHRELPVHGATVLKDSHGKRLSGGKALLPYLFEFLDAYDFAAEGNAEIQEENKTIISAAVLGLIFEKINGYKDGSFFTPGFITMYICRESIRRAVLEKFRGSDIPGLAKVTDFADLKNRIDRTEREIRHKANDLINSLRICDPAVGSGHFLVSALNEIITIKSELGVLCYRDDGDRVKEYRVTVDQDELIVIDKDDDRLFEYVLNRNSRPDEEEQRLQETLFHEKQAIIENSLFGVDINPKSVSICRLRLWIELLKHAYYTKEIGYTDLETLPNIDINIKCGNSLISRFAIRGEANVYATERYKLKAITDRYREKVRFYKQAPADKSILRKEIAGLKEELQRFAVPTDPDLIALRKIKNGLDQLTLGMVSDELEQYRAQVAREEELKRKVEEKLRTFYGNAFEWRFEFPEVLDENGDYIGFDLVIGNPPYGVVFKTEEKLFLKNTYSYIHARTPESYNYFVGKFIEIAKYAGICSFIIPSSFLSQVEFEKTRKLIIEGHSIYRICNLGDGVFQDVVTPTCIVILNKNTTNSNILYNNLYSVNRNMLPKLIASGYKFLDADHFRNNKGNTFTSRQCNDIVKKCYRNESLKNISESVATGVSPGLGEAFVVDLSIIVDLKLEQDLLKKLVTGGEICRYVLNPSLNKYIIYITSSVDISNYNNCKTYLSKFRNQLENRVETISGAIPWYVMLRPRKTKLFENTKILIRQTANRIIAAYDEQGWYCLKSGIIVQLPEKSDIHYLYLLALLNSKLIDFIYRDIVNEDNRIFPEVKPVQLSKIPIKVANQTDQFPIIERVRQILSNADGTDIPRLEAEIDRIVYALYGLTDEEIAVVEGK